MIVEGIVTTENADGSANIAPMGPRTNPSLARLHLRPFPTAVTFQNLRRTRRGIFHITDDAEMIAKAAVGRLETPSLIPAPNGAGWILADACRWLAFEVCSINESGPRMEMDCEVVERGTLRDFVGFNRAKHAVIELAIIATRLHLLTPAEVSAEVSRLAPLVEKTAGEAEQRAWKFLLDYLPAAQIKGSLDQALPPSPSSN